jgi:hypothetical protein
MRVYREFLLVLCLFVAIGHGTARAGENLPVISKEQLSEWIGQLGDPSFKVRDAAQGKILDLGVAVRPILMAMPPSDSAEIRTRIQQILKTLYQRELARVHIYGVGFYTTNFGKLSTRSAVFSAAKEAIAAKNKKSPSPGKRVWELLDPFMQKTLEEVETLKILDEQLNASGLPSTPAARKLHLDLRRSFEKLFNLPQLYDKTSFAKVELPVEALQMLERRPKLSPLEVRWLNYTISSKAFPDLLKENLATTANGIVTVHVSPSSKPIILVLSAYESTIWKVVADPKANLLQVIVGGYFPQEVIGAKVPIVMKISQTLPGVIRNQDYFYCYTQSGTTYQRMNNHLQQLLGKGVDQFSSAHSYDGAPIVIKADD